VKKRLGFCGYFDLYNMPFRYISLYDFSEKKSPLKPEGMNCGANIFDFLEKRQITYFVSDPESSEEQNFSVLLEQLRREQPDFAFVYWPGLDGLLHRAGNDSPEIPAKLRLYEQWIEGLVAAAETHYADIHLFVFSDHGMANCDEILDLKSRIDALPVRMARDYAVVYDSTMARFWFFNHDARRQITRCLETISQGRILPDAELDRLHVLFPDRYFGELIFLVREGVLICPSHMGERPIRAMHGYHPEDKHSYATLLTNQETLPCEVRALPDLFRLMTHESELAKSENGRIKPLIAPLTRKSAPSL
jgi:hypothetical protein